MGLPLASADAACLLPAVCSVRACLTYARPSLKTSLLSMEWVGSAGSMALAPHALMCWNGFAANFRMA